MATVAGEISRKKGVPDGHPELTPLIADNGDDVRVVLVRFVAPPVVGDRFTLDGATWEVVRARDHVRGCVARPASKAAS